jgi:hypothetical protein
MDGAFASHRQMLYAQAGVFNNMVSDNRTVTIAMVLLEAHQAARLAAHQFDGTLKVALGHVGRHMPPEYPAELRMLSCARGFATRLGIAESFEVEVGNPVGFEFFRQGGLGESGLAGQWQVADVDKRLNTSALQRRDKFVHSGAFVANGVKTARHVFTLLLDTTINQRW